MEHTYYEHYDFEPNEYLRIEPSSFIVPDGMNARYWHNHLELIQLISGSCNVILDDTVYSLEMEKTLIIRPGCMRQFEWLKGPIHINRIIVNEHLFMNHDLYSEPFITESYHLGLYHHLNTILYSATDLVTDTTLMEQLTESLRQLMTHHIPTYTIKRSQAHTQQLIVQRAIHFIHLNYHKNISLDDICYALGISKFYFCRIFKEQTETTVNHYLNEVRCHYAFALLSTTSLKIGAIAEACGYQSLSYFTKTFKQLYGFPPSHVVREVA